MAVTLREEVSEKLTGFCVPGCFRFFGGQERSDMNAFCAASDVGDEAAGVFSFGDPAEAGGVVALSPPIRAVFLLSADAEVAATVIEPVAVYVVNDNLRVGNAEDKPMHEDVALPAFGAIATKLAICAAYCGNGIQRVGARAKFAGLPLVVGNESRICVVNDCDLILGERDMHDDCSFGNTLCSVAAPCKVQGFGDQPSRDNGIVGASWQ
jgi:hypothetical protein